MPPQHPPQKERKKKKNDEINIPPPRIEQTVSKTT